MEKQNVKGKCFVALKGMLKLCMLMGIFYSGFALGQSTDTGIGGIAQNITGEFSKIGQLILAIAFLAGIGFIMAAIFKFKQHKDSPQQIPLGTPLAMLVIGAFLVFMPSLIAPAGVTIFGGKATPGGFTGAGVSAIPGAS